jgi:MFS family permease
MQKLQLFKSRDISTVISDTVNFIKTEKNLMKWVYTYLIPAYIILGVIVGIAMKDLTALYSDILTDVLKGDFQADDIKDLAEKMQGANAGAMSGLSSLGSIGAVILGAIVASLTFNYVKASEAKGVVSEDETKGFLTKDIGWYIGYSILLGFVLVLGILGFALFGAIGFAVNTGLGAITMIVAILAAIYFMLRYVLMFFPVCFFENKDFGAALKRGSALVKTNFWGTLGLAILGGLIIGVGGSIASGILGAIGSIFGDMGKSVFAQVGQNLVAAFGAVAMNIGYSLWYGNLCHNADGTTSSSNTNIIDEIGQKDDADIMNRW